MLGLVDLFGSTFWFGVCLDAEKILKCNLIWINIALNEYMKLSHLLNFIFIISLYIHSLNFMVGVTDCHLVMWVITWCWGRFADVADWISMLVISFECWSPTKTFKDSGSLWPKNGRYKHLKVVIDTFRLEQPSPTWMKPLWGGSQLRVIHLVTIWQTLEWYTFILISLSWMPINHQMHRWPVTALIWRLQTGVPIYRSILKFNLNAK